MVHKVSSTGLVQVGNLSTTEKVHASGKKSITKNVPCHTAARGKTKGRSRARKIHGAMCIGLKSCSSRRTPVAGGKQTSHPKWNWKCGPERKEKMTMHLIGIVRHKEAVLQFWVSTSLVKGIQLSSERLPKMNLPENVTCGQSSSCLCSQLNPLLAEY